MKSEAIKLATAKLLKPLAEKFWRYCYRRAVIRQRVRDARQDNHLDDRADQTGVDRE